MRLAWRKMNKRLELKFDDLLDGRLTALEARELRAAIETDPELERSFEAYERVRSAESLLREQEFSLPARFTARVMEEIQRPHPSPLREFLGDLLMPRRMAWAGATTAVLAVLVISVTLNVQREEYSLQAPVAVEQRAERPEKDSVEPESAAVLQKEKSPEPSSAHRDLIASELLGPNSAHEQNAPAAPFPSKEKGPAISGGKIEPKAREERRSEPADTAPLRKEGLAARSYQEHEAAPGKEPAAPSGFASMLRQIEAGQVWRFDQAAIDLFIGGFDYWASTASDSDSDSELIFHRAVGESVLQPGKKFLLIELDGEAALSQVEIELIAPEPAAFRRVGYSIWKRFSHENITIGDFNAGRHYVMAFYLDLKREPEGLGEIRLSYQGKQGGPQERFYPLNLRIDSKEPRPDFDLAEAVCGLAEKLAGISIGASNWAELERLTGGQRAQNDPAVSRLNRIIKALEVKEYNK
jgi:hypothetical protein